MIYEKILCNYISNRTAMVRINNVVSKKIDLQSGVLQGGILSPTLYILFTADTPPPGPGTVDITFADNNSQVVIYPSRDRSKLLNTDFVWVPILLTIPLWQSRKTDSHSPIWNGQEHNIVLEGFSCLHPRRGVRCFIKFTAPIVLCLRTPRVVSKTGSCL